MKIKLIWMLIVQINEAFCKEIRSNLRTYPVIFQSVCSEFLWEKWASAKEDTSFCKVIIHSLFINLLTLSSN